MTISRYGELPRFTQPVDAMTAEERQLFVDRAAFVIAKLAMIDRLHEYPRYSKGYIYHDIYTRQYAAILATAQPVDDQWRKRYEPGLDALIAAHAPKQHLSQHLIVGGHHAVDTALRLIRTFYRLGDLTVVDGKAIRLSPERGEEYGHGY
jgi:hypothetical protein